MTESRDQLKALFTKVSRRNQLCISTSEQLPHDTLHSFRNFPALKFWAEFKRWKQVRLISHAQLYVCLEEMTLRPMHGEKAVGTGVTQPAPSAALPGRLPPGLHPRLGPS